jgi:hypothetical protein
MKLSPKVSRYFFYGLVVAGALFLCTTLTLNSFTNVGERFGINPMWLGGLCCVVPFVLGGLALANESS